MQGAMCAGGILGSISEAFTLHSFYFAFPAPVSVLT